MPTTPNGHQYRVTKAGTSGFSEPSWPVKGMVTNGTVDFAEHDLLASLGWSCSDLKDAALPLADALSRWRRRHQVARRRSRSIRQHPLRSTTPTVAIGGSAAEALAALLAPDRQR